MNDNHEIELPDGFDHQAFLSIDSTNREAVRKIREGAKSGLWITADEQTGGRGRGGREWISKPGNLYCSLIYETDGDIRKAAQLSFVTALAVHETISAFLHLDDIKCKWPNDVLVRGKKICGILLESHTCDIQKKEFMIIGIGINIEHHPDVTLYETTHLNEQTDKSFGHIDVFSILAQKMFEWILKWQADGFASVREKWLENCRGLGEMITVKLPEEKLVGRFIDLDSDGALKLETDTEIMTIHSGDVFFNGRDR